MDPLFITVGMLARTLLLVVPEFTKKDVFKIAAAIFVGMGAAGKAESLYALPVGFIVIIAILYKDKILPKITEGTLLLHGLVALFIWNHTRDGLAELSTSSLVLGAFLVLFSLSVCTLCFLSKRIGFKTQTLLYAFFLAVNCYIAYITSINFLTHDTSILGQLMLGFYGLTFVSSILYLLNFIPIPLGKRETFKQRFAAIKIHASDLAEAYFDIDVKHLHTFGILGIFVTMTLFVYLGLDWITVTAAALLIGSFFTTPRAPSEFMPKAVAEKI